METGQELHASDTHPHSAQYCTDATVHTTQASPPHNNAASPSLQSQAAEHSPSVCSEEADHSKSNQTTLRCDKSDHTPLHIDTTDHTPLHNDTTDHTPPHNDTTDHTPPHNDTTDHTPSSQSVGNGNPPPAQSSRERVVPVQCAITSVSVNTFPAAPASGATQAPNGTSCPQSSERESTLNGASYSEYSGPPNSSKDAVSPKSPGTDATEHAVVDTALNTTPSAGQCSSSSAFVAVGYDRSRCVSVYRALPGSLQHLATAALPAPASTVVWLAADTLAVVCPVQSTAPGGCGDGGTPVLVWRWSGEDLVPLPSHPLAVFAEENKHRFYDAPRMDATVLFKQRYDNVADYQKKKLSRLQQQEINEANRAQLPSCKRLRIAD